MSNFKKALYKKIRYSINNNYGIENYDEYRFGAYESKTNDSKKHNVSLKNLKKVIKKTIGYHAEIELYYKRADEFVEDYLHGIYSLWDIISKKDKKLLISLIAYRLLGFKKVKLPRNNVLYWNAIEQAKKLSNSNDTYDPNFMHFILEKFDLEPIDYDIKLYFSEIGIAIDYIIEQYAYKINDKDIVAVENDDVVLDIGACWGDTALYFAHKSGDNGKIFSFEFIPNNIKLFNINTSFNPMLLKRIELIQLPVSKKSEDTIYYMDNGPGSRVELKPFEGQTGSCKTISVDDFVKSKNLKKVDFIKMDIEGAEPMALEGAIETIKTFRPKLAIATYHSFDDFVNIPNWILDLNLGYEIFLGHYTIHSEETICFAKPKNY
ncbi:FkbM family methyltransferase [Ichthyenterobacterium magnum]|uniref:FkbM family methyltransferase n=1 Tax=Ichthyenterobacterium magnum TaxID=1230530 RepID=A0A420DV21_9FLAO|nr:FkbM family methyltransferase [Ichthyenterobacterium magnum]RKE98000.1 FkbM family methyltransferase [Ichthyenterobacterium magnum]